MTQRFAALAFLILMMCGALPAAAQERVITLAAPDTLIESGFLKYVLPRFSLKHSIRITLVPEGEPAQVTLGSEGRPVFMRGEEVFAMEVVEATDFTAKFAEWLRSTTGLKAVTGFKVDGVAPFGPPEVVETAVVELTLDGDAARGEDLSYRMCGRCHVVGARNRMSGIGSTPSFPVMKTFPDWQDRFMAFYALKPHGAFTQIEEVTPPFDPEHPPSIAPLEMTLDDLDNILSFVASIPAADLGRPIQFQ